MKISVVIPAYNEEHYIGVCLDYIIRNAKGSLHEIIVIDNASTDRTREIASSKPGVKVVTEKIKGLTRARQRGLEEATGDLIAYLDADTRLPENWLDKARWTFANDPEVVSLSGPYRYYDGKRWKNTLMHGLWYITAPLTFRTVGYMVLGGNFIAKRKALTDMGGFDKNIDFYGEDTDIARRLSPFGKVIFRMDFFIYSSSRRLNEEGFIKTNVVYALNFIWQVIFHRPFSSSYRDIRTVSPLSVSQVDSRTEKLATSKALFWSSVFGAIGLYALIRDILMRTSMSPPPPAIVPLSIFYAILVINTYFSIWLFAHIASRKDTRNNLLDIVLGLFYVAMAFSLKVPVRFVFFDLLLFIIATMKYSFLLGIVEHSAVVRKKILADILGILLCTLVLGGSIVGYPLYSSWALCAVFAVANIFIFFVRPLYKLDS